MIEVVANLDGPPALQPFALQPFFDWLMTHMVVGILVLTRLGMVLMALPAIGSGVPRRVRLLLAITMTMLLMPTLAERPGMETLPEITNLIDLALAVVREGVIGMLIGATVQIIITGVQLAGEAITSTGGMQLGDAVDPTTQASMPAIAKFVGMLVTAIMLISGGHRVVLSLLVESFDRLPAGNIVFHSSIMDSVIECMSGAMASGVRVSAPVVAALLLSNLVTGLISRTMPQINVLAIGLSVNALALLVVTALTIGSVTWIFQDDLTNGVDRLSAVWLQSETLPVNAPADLAVADN
ncbi:flagellar biosynthetic protein FliR [Neorhodopirellula pilleata]|uniref:Flagellar biosynthesis protein FliR n=1 Tax=Neorhodopirellula pilleata TaxID=2714738 RepID=A0A5C6AWD5_9BACT|nr:flagellar biosynthetic protein FliR [Neorhodopirellula pilleata]TWU03459.1 flagellar biosynthesis protein FliR [Neorhodopirellula pilleata]